MGKATTVNVCPTSISFKEHLSCINDVLSVLLASVALAKKP